MKTLERYFRDELEAGNIDHTLRASILSDGRVYFYIHPATASGDTQTQDFTVEFNSLTTHEGQPNARHHGEAVADTVQDDVRRVFPRLGPWCDGCLQQGDGVCMIHSCVRYPPNAHALAEERSDDSQQRVVGNLNGGGR